MKTSQFSQLSPDERAFLEKRQADNGYADIDGAVTAMAERGSPLPRSTVGRVNTYLKRRASGMKDKQEAMTSILTALGSKAHDIGLVNIALLHDHSQDIMEKLQLEQIDLGELEPVDRLAAFFKLAGVQRDTATAALQLQRSKDALEEKVKQVADEAQAIAEEGGLSDEFAEKLRAKILGLAA